MALTLYMNYLSQPCRALVILCRFNNIPLEEVILQNVMTETRKEWFAKLNPMRRIPVMKEGDFVLTESFAMAEYLANTRSLAAHWFPKDVRTRARLDEYVLWHFCQGGIRDTSPPYFLGHTLIPMMTGKELEPEKMQLRVKLLERSLTQLETYFMIRGDFITGSELTVADLFAICELTQVTSIGYDIKKDRPRLGAWFDRVKARLQPHFDDVHKTIMSTFGSSNKL